MSCCTSLYFSALYTIAYSSSVNCMQSFSYLYHITLYHGFLKLTVLKSFALHSVIQVLICLEKSLCFVQRLQSSSDLYFTALNYRFVFYLLCSEQHILKCTTSLRSFVLVKWKTNILFVVKNILISSRDSIHKENTIKYQVQSNVKVQQ